MTDPLLAAAAAALRRAPDPRAAAVGGRTAARTRRTPRRSVWIGSAFPATARPGDVLRVTDRAVVSAIRVAVAALPGVRPLRVGLDLTGHDCHHVEVTVATAYGLVVQVLAEDVRTAARAVLVDALGIAPGDPVPPVDVRIGDVDD